MKKHKGRCKYLRNILTPCWRRRSGTHDDDGIPSKSPKKTPVISTKQDVSARATPSGQSATASQDSSECHSSADELFGVSGWAEKKKDKNKKGKGMEVVELDAVAPTVTISSGNILQSRLDVKQKNKRRPTSEHRRRRRHTSDNRSSINSEDSLDDLDESSEDNLIQCPPDKPQISPVAPIVVVHSEQDGQSKKSPPAKNSSSPPPNLLQNLGKKPVLGKVLAEISAETKEDESKESKSKETKDDESRKRRSKERGSQKKGSTDGGQKESTSDDVFFTNGEGHAEANTGTAVIQEIAPKSKLKSPKNSEKSPEVKVVKSTDAAEVGTGKVKKAPSQPKPKKKSGSEAVVNAEKSEIPEEKKIKPVEVNEGGVTVKEGGVTVNEGGITVDAKEEEECEGLIQPAPRRDSTKRKSGKKNRVTSEIKEEKINRNRVEVVDVRELGEGGLETNDTEYNSKSLQKQKGAKSSSIQPTIVDKSPDGFEPVDNNNVKIEVQSGSILRTRNSTDQEVSPEDTSTEGRNVTSLSSSDFKSDDVSSTGENSDNVDAKIAKPGSDIKQSISLKETSVEVVPKPAMRNSTFTYGIVPNSEDFQAISKRASVLQSQNRNWDDLGKPKKDSEEKKPVEFPVLNKVKNKPAIIEPLCEDVENVDADVATPSIRPASRRLKKIAKDEPAVLTDTTVKTSAATSERNSFFASDKEVKRASNVPEIKAGETDTPRNSVVEKLGSGINISSTRLSSRNLKPVTKVLPDGDDKPGAGVNFASENPSRISSRNLKTGSKEQTDTGSLLKKSKDIENKDKKVDSRDSSISLVNTGDDRKPEKAEKETEEKGAGPFAEKMKSKQSLTASMSVPFPLKSLERAKEEKNVDAATSNGDLSSTKVKLRPAVMAKSFSGQVTSGETTKAPWAEKVQRMTQIREMRVEEKRSSKVEEPTGDTDGSMERGSSSRSSVRDMIKRLQAQANQPEKA